MCCEQLEFCFLDKCFFRENVIWILLTVLLFFCSDWYYQKEGHDKRPSCSIPCWMFSIRSRTSGTSKKVGRVICRWQTSRRLPEGDDTTAQTFEENSLRNLSTVSVLHTSQVYATSTPLFSFEAWTVVSIVICMRIFWRIQIKHVFRKLIFIRLDCKETRSSAVHNSVSDMGTISLILICLGKNRSICHV